MASPMIAKLEREFERRLHELEARLHALEDHIHTVDHDAHAGLHEAHTVHSLQSSREVTGEPPSVR